MRKLLKRQLVVFGIDIALVIVIKNMIETSIKELLMLQEIILKKYEDVYGKKTLKFVSENTGIQISRVFRIMNGASMKLKEYEAFRSAVHREQGTRDNVQMLAERCADFLPKESLIEIEKMLSRKLAYTEIKSGLKYTNERGVASC